MRTEVLIQPTSTTTPKKSATALQATKHVAKFVMIVLLLIATVIVLYVAS